MASTELIKISLQRRADNHPFHNVTRDTQNTTFLQGLKMTRFPLHISRHKEVNTGSKGIQWLISGLWLNAMIFYFYIYYN